MSTTNHAFLYLRVYAAAAADDASDAVSCQRHIPQKHTCAGTCTFDEHFSEQHTDHIEKSERSVPYFTPARSKKGYETNP